ncbi:MAG: hypothetical protein WB992_19500 [Bryobacteraceae bacterium]
MLRFTVAVILLAGIPLCWYPLRGQPPGIGKHSGRNQKKQPTLSAPQPEQDQRGTPDSPFVVDIKQRPDAQAKTAEDKRKDDAKEYRDRWAFRLTVIGAVISGLVLLIGAGGVIAAVRTLRAINRQADLIEKQAIIMERQATEARETAVQQARDVQASIAEATRSAGAMERVAESMAVNAESVKESVSISREIATTQKIAMELQSRAYLSVLFSSALYQDANHVFEVEAAIRNHGNTPAYGVVFKSAVQITPMPIPEDFSFPLPDDSAGPSVSLLAPGTTKVFSRAVSARVSEDSVESIKRGGPPQCLAMWGIVNYLDAFNKTRYTKFAFTLYWRPWIPGKDRDEHGDLRDEPVYSRDMLYHNEAD